MFYACLLHRGRKAIGLQDGEEKEDEEEDGEEEDVEGEEEEC